MVQTFSDDKKIYSVDMMFAYLDIIKHPVKQVETKSLLKTLQYKGWGDPENNIFYSPYDVLKDPKNKIYKKEIDRIKKADLNFPIIMYENHIVDGVHRLTKAYMNKVEKIKAYTFTKKEMQKFLIDNSGNWTKVNKMTTSDFIKLFHKRFCK